MAHGDAREGKRRGNWRKEWVASTFHTTSEHVVSSITARLKRDGTRAENRFGLSTKRTSPFKLAGGWGGGQFSQLLAAEVVSSVNYWQPRCEHQQ